MALLAQYNTLGFYTDKTARQWDKSIELGADHEMYRVFFQANKIPAFQLIVDNATSATVQLMDGNDVLVGTAKTVTVEAATGYVKLIYLGETLTGGNVLPDGDYSLKVVTNLETFYSDIFGWTSDSEDLNDLLKISCVSSDIRLGRTYILNLTGFTFECYLNAIYLGINPEFEEEVSQKDGINNVLYGNLVNQRQWDIDGCEYIFRFLLGLRVLESNGTVTVTWKGVSYTANDIMAEKTEDHFTDLMQVKLSFTDISEIVSVYNEIN
jgi:hypothetical protein